MQESSFRKWLEERYDERTCSSRVSNCRRIEQFEGDLDLHFTQDQMRSILERLDYSSDDRARGATPRHNIPIAGDVRNGTATLRYAASLYLTYKSGDSTHVVRRNISETATTGKWPEWQTPSTNEILQLARSVTPYIRFLAPSIIEAVVEDTAKHYEEWTTSLTTRGIDASSYLWPQTSCVFPGVRRHAGSAEIARFRGRAEKQQEQNALTTDDNTYPKHIWSFALRGRTFQNSGPSGFALAHLCDHKVYKNRAHTEIVGDSTGRTLFGLYTSAANTAYAPTSAIRPTDFVPEFRNLLQRKAEALYGGFCKLLPPGSSFMSSPSEEWAISNFSWADPVGNIDWMPSFLEFRRAEMNTLLKSR